MKILQPSSMASLRYNERRVLQVLRRMNHASKAEIARSANLTNAAVGSIVSALEKQGLIISGKKEHKGTRGQPATMIRLNSTGAFGIGVRIERNGFHTILIDFDGNILSRFSNEMLLPDPQTTLEKVCVDIQSALAILPADSRSRLTGIGVAQPYNLGSWLSELGLPAASFRQWDSFDFAKSVEKATGIPTINENDGTAAAVAELFYGVGRKLDDFLYLFFGPSLGGGLVLKGDIVQGNSGNAADVGLMPVAPSSLPSAVKPPGAWDILLNRSSLNSLRRHLKYRFPTIDVDSRMQLEQAFETGEEALQEWLDDCVDALVPSILSAKALLDFPNVVLEANIDSELLLPLIGDKLKTALNRNVPESRFAPEFIYGSFGYDAGAIGAASLPIFYSFSPRKPIA